MRFRSHSDPVDQDPALVRISERLAADEAGDPTYRPGRFAQLIVAQGQLESALTERRLVGSPIRSPLLGGLGAGSVALALVIAIGLLAIRLDDSSQTGTSPQPSAGDLLSQVRTSGVLRVAIRPDFPQATTEKLSGFDVDVATAVAARLGVRPEVVIVEATRMAAPDSFDRWDLAMPSSSIMAGSDAFVSGGPYYAFPTFLVVADGSTAQTPSDLDGARVCVVADSPGEAWLAGSEPDAVVPPPSGGPSARVEGDDQACLDALAAGEVDAIATATLTAADIGVRPGVRALGQPVLLDSRSILARTGPPDPSALLSAIDAAIADMRTDGTLLDLSRNRFGGQDLTGR